MFKSSILVKSNFTQAWKGILFNWNAFVRIVKFSPKICILLEKHTTSFAFFHFSLPKYLNHSTPLLETNHKNNNNGFKIFIGIFQFYNHIQTNKHRILICLSVLKLVIKLVKKLIYMCDFKFRFFGRPLKYVKFTLLEKTFSGWHDNVFSKTQ